ncbi:MSC_0618 family F1-like ATPase beta subunit [Mycoplasmopsis columbina]|uniref:MSC_0618 family F1-like ATPase beta subunit n=1 Tax=Mycoplasmopsis columbina TaxID=114881 RepID=UPI0004A76239|nr:F0F1 ATP synthase subunit beta [Mycoplasmopsis columbina]VEU76664.1 ATP synthase F1 subunit beta [Mycoplasmopsis columbina]
MSAKISKIWTDVVEVTFNDEQVPAVNTLIEANGTYLLVKKIINNNSILAVIISSEATFAIDQEVKALHHSFMVPVGQKSKGKIFDVLGQPLNSNQKGYKYVEMDSTNKPNSNYENKTKILETGIKAIDFFIPILDGSKIGIFGGAGVGKTVLMKEIIFNLSKQQKNTSSIFIGSGERSREAIELYDDLQESNLMNSSVMFISRMNESPGARMSIVPVGVTAAEYLRDVEKENVLLFVDNIFRFLQAGNETAASLDKKASIGGYQATLNTEISQIEQRIYSNENGSITSFQTVFLPMDDLSDPSAVATFNHLNGSLVLSRDISAKNIFPAFDPLASSSTNIDPQIIGKEHFEAILEAKQVLQKYKELEDVMLILGFEELDEESKIAVKKALQLQNFMSQSFFMTEQFRQVPGVFVPMKKTIESVRKILDGKYSHLNPETFSYIASTDELDEKLDQEINA